MDIAAHQDTIRNLMRSSLSERSNVRSVKRRKSTLSGNGTSPPIIVCNENSECTLSKSWTHQDRLSVPRLQLSQARRDGSASERLLDSFPQASALLIGGGIAFELYNRRGEAFGDGYPLRSIKEKRLSKDAAPYYEIGWIIRFDPSISGNSRANFSKRACSIRFFECFPRQRAWHRICVSKHPATDNKVIGRMQFEE